MQRAVDNAVFLIQEALLGILAVAFLAWAGVVWKASKTLSEKFDNMRREFHEYTITMEHRITEVESMIQHLGDSFRIATSRKE